MYTELTTRKIIREMSDEIWTSEDRGYIVVPDTPDEVDQVLDFLAPYFDDIDGSSNCMYDGCECDDDYNGAAIPELPDHDPSVA